ncbi:nuclear speckle splicing regulatory protein 1 [Siphateles boraxobius]|uniref:nuclear speckle splicing regulatory protein 1 n=1 Tax=Siphateles boraxobius TaxID=180520 RepID=UPI0040641639
MATSGKQYGLILPQKSASKSALLSRPSVFGDDSDDETSVGESLKKEAAKKKMMKQTRLEMQKALQEDSTVYEYDNVYDDIQKERLESNKKMLGGTDKKPKYINQLLRAVEERKKEQERRDERKIQKEREAEGEMFADKEAFVTSAYRQKLKERQEELEREKREAALEAALDVKKQKDLSGFYRHLLNQTVGEESVPDRSAQREDKATCSAAGERSPTPEPTLKQRESEAESHSDEDQSDNRAVFNKTTTSGNHSKRQYRQKSPHSDSGDEEDRERKEIRERSLKDRDRDRTKEKERTRDREREDKHSHRKEDRDRRRERERDRDREEDRGRDRRERDRDDRHGKRDRRNSSPKERERERKGEQDRDRRDNSPKDRERDRKGERDLRDRESQKMDSKGKIGDEEKISEGKTENAKEEEEKVIETEDKGEAKREPSKFAKRSCDQTVNSARERYLARQITRFAAKPYIEKDDD